MTRVTTSFINRVQLQRIFTDLKSLGWEITHTKHVLLLNNAEKDNHVSINKTSKVIIMYSTLDMTEYRLINGILKIYGMSS